MPLHCMRYDLPLKLDMGNTEMKQTRIDILGHTFDDFTGVLKTRYGKGLYHARAAYRQVFQRGTPAIAGLPEFARSPELALDVERAISYHPGAVVDEQRQGDLLKFVTRLDDGQQIESVIVPMATHTTVCISCQAGCRMGCRFCRTGRLGLKRNLTASEIVGQVVNARFKYGIIAPNIVFMGMGEPFDNFENVVQAVGVLSDQRGLDIAHRHITVSTMGLVDGISRLGALNWPKLNLAISLNAADDETRCRIMPVNRKFPLAALKRALAAFPLGRNGSFLIGYVLIQGINNSRQDARNLAGYLDSLKVKVNLIPFNTGEGLYYRPPAAQNVLRFRDWLIEENVFVRLRSAKGGDIRAACGQLGGSGPQPSRTAR